MRKAGSTVFHKPQTMLHTYKQLYLWSLNRAWERKYTMKQKRENMLVAFHRKEIKRQTGLK